MTMIRLGLGADAVPHLDGILDCAREVGNSQMFVEVAPVMALALATTGAPERAHGVLTELIELPGSCEDTALVRQFPALIRATVACGDTALGERFVAAMQRGTPAQEHGLQAGRALLAEARGDTEDAATRHADAARRWREFGDLSELTPALVGLARCTDDPASGTRRSPRPCRCSPRWVTRPCSPRRVRWVAETLPRLPAMTEGCSTPYAGWPGATPTRTAGPRPRSSCSST